MTLHMILCIVLWQQDYIAHIKAKTERTCTSAVDLCRCPHFSIPTSVKWESDVHPQLCSPIVLL